MSVTGPFPMEIPRKMWTISPREPQVAALVRSLDDHQLVILAGPRGTGKSNYSICAAQRLVEKQPGLRVLNGSEYAPKAFEQAVRELTHGLVILDATKRATPHLGEALLEAIEDRDVKVIIETPSATQLPEQYKTLKNNTHRTTITISQLGRQDFRDRLVEYLGGPVPYRISDFFWSACGGNQELAQMAINGLVRNGELAPGKYAWVWNGPLVAPDEVVQHVERQFENLDASQQDFVARLALAGSVPLTKVNAFISDESLEFLQDAGFVKQTERSDKGIVTQLQAPLFGWVLERNARASVRKHVFETTEPPTRGIEDPVAMLAWVSSAMRLGVPLTTDQIILGNDSAFTLMSWNIIEEFVDLKIPANKSSQEIIKIVTAQPYEEQTKLVFILLQRALANFFNALHDRARTDAKNARAIYDLAPQELSSIAHWIVELELIVAGVFPDVGFAKALLTQEIARAHEHNLPHLAERYTYTMYGGANTAIENRDPLDEVLAAIGDPHANNGAVLTAVPVAVIRLANAGRYQELDALIRRAMAFREMRITNLPENPYTFSFGEVLSKGSHSYLMFGRTAEMWKLRSLNLAGLFLDPTFAQYLAGLEHGLAGRWGQALLEFRGALQYLEIHDHHRLKKIIITGYIKALVETQQPSIALQAIAEYNTLDWGSRAVSEGEGDLTVITAKYALSVTTFKAELDAFLVKFEDAQEWFHVLRAAHLGAVAHRGVQREIYADRMREAAKHVDQALAELWIADVEAVISGDESLLIHTRPAIVAYGAWIPINHEPLVLSRRQKEIAELVARGLTNKEIAENLYLSVRTVESHVAAILNKVGLTDRRRLASKLLTLV